MFHELDEESKIIFWKRFEQFLDFAKINHLQKIKKFLESSWKNFVHSLSNFNNFFTLSVLSGSS